MLKHFEMHIQRSGSCKYKDNDPVYCFYEAFSCQYLCSCNHKGQNRLYFGTRINEI